MKKRPLSIRLITVTFLLAPVGMVLQLLWLYHIPLDQWYYVFTPGIWLPQVLALTIITPIVGLCVWTVRPWAYPVLLVWTALVVANNLSFWITGQTLTRLPERTLLVAGIVALVLLEVRRQFYAPYFNPRLRYWEQAQRYSTTRIRVNVKTFGKDEVLFEARSFDVSATGIYVVSGEPVANGDMFGLDVILPSGEVHHAAGQVVWVNPGRDRYPQGFGCHFTAVGKNFRAALSQSLKAIHAEVKLNR